MNIKLRINHYNSILNLLIRLISKNTNNIICKNILVHRVGSIGDTIVSLPAIYKLKKINSKCKITVLYCEDDVSFNNIKNLTNHYIDEYISYSLANNNILESIKLIIELRKKKFDLWLSLPQDLTSFFKELRNIFFSFLVNTKTIYGFRVNIDKSIIKYSQDDFHLNEKIRLLNIVEELFKYNSTKFIEDHNFLNINKKKLSLKLDSNKKILSISIGTNRLPNKWDYKNYIYISRKWIAKGGYVLLIGGEKELDESIKIEKAIDNKNLFNFVSKLNIEESTYLISKSYVFLSNDTGMMHIADLLKLNIVSIFSSRDFKGKWYPTSFNNKVFRPDKKCDCFLKSFCKYSCINKIKKTDVWNYINSI